MNVCLNGTIHKFTGFRILHNSQERCLVEYYKSTPEASEPQPNITVPPSPKRKRVLKRSNKPETSEEEEQESEYESPIEEEEKPKKPCRKRFQKIPTDDDDDEEHKHDTVEEKEADPRDKLAWTHERILAGDFWMYDCQGNLLLPTDKKSVTFVVSKSGTVLARDHPGFVEVCYVDPKNADVNLYAPGHMEELKMVNELPQIRFSWLKEDTVYRKQNPQPFSTFSKLIASKTHWMPLDAVSASLMHLPRSVKEKRMQNYKYVLNQFETDNHFGLLSYTHELNGTKYQRAEIADVYDFLEFYHIPDEYIWRSALGTYIYNNFIVYALDFGGKPRKEMVSQLLCSTSFSGKEAEGSYTGERGVCEACGKTHVMTHHVRLDDGHEWNVGCVCVKRMEYLYDIGKVMRHFRDVKEFDKDAVNVFIPTMKSLQDNHRMEAESDHNRFSGTGEFF